MSLYSYFYLYWSIIVFVNIVAIFQCIFLSAPVGKFTFLSFFAFCSLLILVPSRPVCYEMADTVHYAANFTEANFDIYELGFNLLGNFCSRHCSLYSFFMVITAITLFVIYLALKNQNKAQTAILFVGFISSLVAWSILHNTLRQGIALAFSFLAVTLWIKNKKTALCCLFTALLFHNSTLFFIAAVFGILLLKELKYYWCIWFSCVLLSLFDIPVKFYSLVSFINPQKMTLYTETFGSNDYSTGFRLDFLLYSMLPFAIYYYCKYFKKNVIQDEAYKNMLKWYILLNAIWILCIRLPFSDRFAMPSWVFFSTLVIYPLIVTPTLRNRIACSSYLLLQLAFSIYSCIKHTLFRGIY